MLLVVGEINWYKVVTLYKEWYVTIWTAECLQCYLLELFNENLLMKNSGMIWQPIYGSPFQDNPCEPVPEMIEHLNRHYIYENCLSLGTL